MGSSPNRCTASFPRVADPLAVPAAPGAPILYFGRLSAEKGLTDLLRAMRRLPRINCRSRAKVRNEKNWNIWLENGALTTLSSLDISQVKRLNRRDCRRVLQRSSISCL